VPGPVLQIGNTNSRYRFSVGVKEFMNEWSKAGPAHHCAIGIGHVADKLRKVGELLGIDVQRVCWLEYLNIYPLIEVRKCPKGSADRQLEDCFAMQNGAKQKPSIIM